MKSIDYSKVKVADGFWAEKQKTLRRTTVGTVYDRFSDTHRFSALECKWREGDPHEPHLYWDSDVAKWCEGVSYLLKFEDNAEWRAVIERVIDLFIENSDENGYFNSHFLVTEKDRRFVDRHSHELYCLGHWIEAAVAYHGATGDMRFVDAVCKYADYVERAFKKERSAVFATPGHPEIELALVRLYEVTGEARYLELSKYFIDEHGMHPEDLRVEDRYSWMDAEYNQDAMPLRQRKTIDGHSVRALYLLSGMIDVAELTGDGELAAACKRLIDNCVDKRMYITGGVGSTKIGEAFTVDYHLPSRRAYAETCAAISLAMAANRYLKLEENAKYADVVERVIYNGAISGISTDGRSFFYENPLEIDLDFNNVNVATKQKERFAITKRVEVFGCSCCPPNIIRLIASIGGYAYAENGDTAFINQYISSEMNNGSSRISVKCAYPCEENVHISYKGDKKWLAMRIPGWCRDFTLNAEYEMKSGYAFVRTEGACEIELTLKMPVRVLSANRRVHECAGRVAVMRGPVVYCAEGIDNGEDIKTVSVDPTAEFKTVPGEFIFPNIKTKAYRPIGTDDLYADYTEEQEEIDFTLIPYYAFANRKDSDMQVWLLKK